MDPSRTIILTEREDGFCSSFDAMASPCEVIVETLNKTLARQLGETIAHEVWRLQDKYSRYDQQSICSKINNSKGQAVSLDQESYLLLTFADQCYQLSDGLFDITSGVLRKLWKFDGGSHIPDENQVKQLMAHVGWSKVKFDEQSICLPDGMELDFGGIGKEYAVDRSIILAREISDVPVLVNLGGDLCATAPRKNNRAWQVGIEHPGFTGKKDMIVSLYQGALATSGDAKRFLLRDGTRYSHILNARTGWPVEQAPRSMTVAAPQCVQAGILATLALLQGAEAEQFLTEQEVKFWAIR